MLYRFMDKQARTRGDQISTEAVCNMLIFARYKASTAPDATVLKTLSVAGEIRGLCHLVALILTVEAGFAENDPMVQTEFIEVIASELRRKGVPDEYAFGDDPHYDSATLWFLYRESISQAQVLLHDAGYTTRSQVPNDRADG